MENTFYGTLGRLFFFLLTGFILYKLIEWLTDKINIQEYTYTGRDLNNNSVVVEWFKANVEDKGRHKKEKIKFENNKLYFRVYSQFYKGSSNPPLQAAKSIDVDNKDTYDAKIFVLIKKKDLSFSVRTKLIWWLIKEWAINCLSNNCTRQKELPWFILNPYVFNDPVCFNLALLSKLIEDKVKYSFENEKKKKEK